MYPSLPLSSLLVLPLHLILTSARLLHSLPEDTYAFPKFRVSFLNGMPVHNETAQRWLNDGLRGGELEFLDQAWQEQSWQASSSRKEIGSADLPPNQNLPTLNSIFAPHANYSLELIKMGPRDSYVCLIPKPPDNNPSTAEDEAESEISPARSWSLLQPLTGTCLYHRQGWFTYSYCHNREIRQFKELIQVHPHHSSGGYKPEEDPEWEAYTLGRAPQGEESGADLTVAEQDVQTTNLELAKTAGSRYLVQRWGDGTTCDKTGKSREVEVQFHCSMTMTDTILFVKETKTCSYVLVVHTPRLCGEPGFKSRRDLGEETQIKCREIIPSTVPSGISLPVTDYPLKLSRHKTVPPGSTAGNKENSKGTQDGKKDKVFGEIFRKTLEALMDENIKSGTGGGEVVIELLEDDGTLEDAGDTEMVNRLTEALRAAGYNVKAERLTPKFRNPEKGEQSQGAEKKRKKTNDINHDEL
ncbi:hypothetical protein AMATHDRAFT_144504 [Amanita thiersii Skay4041]|uniref:Protein OS-9 homolog n=1 Tax=Amanita thiersii Skay4041 TaxID=703135 RepID=A0A2A9NSK6_9AGAR|nr:hypothetical protein AMATHDRAFT_144504 [Amanita thiersii Skay4041]